MLCWKIIESVNALELLCSDNSVSLNSTFPLESRNKQYMATLLLFAKLFPETSLQYLPSGKPVVSNGEYLSISHSGDLVVMMRSAIPCGVDIEQIHPRVEKVKHKFLSDEELTRNSTLEQLTQYWTAKEAMFKVHGTDTVFMRSNIFVKILSPSEADAILLDGELEIKRKIRFRVTDNMILAWTETADEA